VLQERYRVLTEILSELPKLPGLLFSLPGAV
jgi:hypothetical protein